MAHKLRVYLDTSTISHLCHDDAKMRMADTKRLWACLENGEFEACLSRTTLEELDRCPEPKRSLLYGYMGKIRYNVLPVDRQVLDLAWKIVEEGILTPRSFADCLHIATATVHGCDCVVSWNFKHMVNLEKIDGVKRVASLLGYRGIDIVSPKMLLESGVTGYEA